MEKILLNQQIKPKISFKKLIPLSPPRILALGFIGIILLGAILLTLPYATMDSKGLSFLDALFTSTSAVCVTGLVVVDTGTHFTFLGQIVILLLIQIGGLGFMTFATLFAIILGRKITLKERLLLQEALNQVTIEGIVRLAKYVVQITFAIQAAGALILTLRWAGDMGWGRSLYFGIFHAISAFNNAGFDLFGEFASLTGDYQGDVITNITMMLLIIIGGLGFAVLSDLYVHRGHKLTLHSRVVLHSTVILILVGAVVIFVLELTNPRTMAGYDSTTKFLSAFFQSITPRTAGFSTINTAYLRDTTQLFIIILMFIGASPGSTGGGIKTTTFVSILFATISTLKGHCQVSLKERTLAKDVVTKAFTIMILAVLLILVITSILTLTEEADFLTLLFEATSAFGTVGLSLGITPQLSQIGRVAIIITMFCGRVGPLTLAYALNKKKTALGTMKYPEERILIG